ncbi:hypothetical protein AB0I24_15510 [Brachybacterium paraconglomeratum]
MTLRKFAWGIAAALGGGYRYIGSAFGQPEELVRLQREPTLVFEGLDSSALS